MENPIPAPGQIWYLEQPRMPGADDPHYVLVTSVASDWSRVWFHFITTDGEVEKLGDFKIDSSEPEFPATGLKHSSHLRRLQYFNVRIALFTTNEYRGYVSGDLKRKIEDWF